MAVKTSDEFNTRANEATDHKKCLTLHPPMLAYPAIGHSASPRRMSSLSRETLCMQSQRLLRPVILPAKRSYPIRN